MALPAFETNALYRYTRVPTHLSSVTSYIAVDDGVVVDVTTIFTKMNYDIHAVDIRQRHRLTLAFMPFLPRSNEYGS